MPKELSRLALSEREIQKIRFWNEFCNHLNQRGSQLQSERDLATI